MPGDQSYDFVVVGGGSGGFAAARTACDLGLRTAVVDGSETLGGLCILQGCMPSKALIESANRARAVRNANSFGLSVDSLEINTKKILERKRILIDDFAGYRQEQLQSGRFDLIRGQAKFADSRTLEVSPLENGASFPVSFRAACIATGSVVSEIPVPGLADTGYWTSDDVLNAEELPRRVIVLGGGAIALEMACYLEGLGKEVTVIQRSDQLLSCTDRDVADALRTALDSRSNMTIFSGTKLKKAERTPEGDKRVHFLRGENEHAAEADEILLALGRRPNSRHLNLKEAGIGTSPSGHIVCKPTQETSVPGIFAAGDVCGPHEVVHIAIEQGEICARNAAKILAKTETGESRRTPENLEEIDYRLNLLGIFTDPQVAMVGLTENEAKAQGRKTAAATYPFDDHGKSMIMNELHGFVKLIADSETGELLGGAVVGPEAVELIHEIVVAINFRATAEEFLKIPHYHPTLSEIWTYPAEDLIIGN